MEHNHNRLIYGFILSFLVFGVGIALAFLSKNGVDVQSKITLIILGCVFLVIGIIMLKQTFKKRDACPVCLEKYSYKRKKK